MTTAQVRAAAPDVRVRVPATSANLGPGFDAVGLALAWYDDVRARVTGTTGLEVDVVGVGEDDVPRDHRNLVVRAMDATFAALGRQRPGLALRCENRIPHGRGLGSSAAAVVAGVLLARALAENGANERYDDDAALAVAATLEGHPDNVAAAMLGGVTIAWQETELDAAEPGGVVRAVRLHPHPSLVALLLVPDSAVLATDRARAMLPATVPHRDAAFAAGRAALLVHALTSDPTVLLPATEDRLHQDSRAAAMPTSIEALHRLRDQGMAAVVSGAGPSLLVLGAGNVDVEDVLHHGGPGWSARLVPVELEGARLVRPAAGD